MRQLNTNCILSLFEFVELFRKKYSDKCYYSPEPNTILTSKKRSLPKEVCWLPPQMYFYMSELLTGTHCTCIEGTSLHFSEDFYSWKSINRVGLGRICMHILLHVKKYQYSTNLDLNTYDLFEDKIGHFSFFDCHSVASVDIISLPNATQ